MVPSGRRVSTPVFSLVDAWDDAIYRLPQRCQCRSRLAKYVTVTSRCWAGRVVGLLLFSGLRHIPEHRLRVPCVLEKAMRQLMSCRYHRLLPRQVCVCLLLIPVLRKHWMIRKMRDNVAPFVQRCASRERGHQRYAGTRAIKFYIGLQMREY